MSESCHTFRSIMSQSVLGGCYVRSDVFQMHVYEYTRKRTHTHTRARSLSLSLKHTYLYRVHKIALFVCVFVCALYLCARAHVFARACLRA